MKQIMTQILNITRRLIGIPVQQAPREVIVYQPSFSTVKPDVEMGLREWMRKYKVGSQYSRFAPKKPQERISMLDIYKHESK